MVLGESPGRSGHRFFAVAYLLTKGRRSVAGYTEDRPYSSLKV
jgi:hypothetical protein